MKQILAIRAQLICVFMLVGCTSMVILDKPAAEVREHVEAMWHTDPVSVYSPRDEVKVEQETSGIKYTIDHFSEMSGVVVPRARTFIWVDALSDTKTQVRVSAQDIGLIFCSRNCDREQWVLKRLEEIESPNLQTDGTRP